MSNIASRKFLKPEYAQKRSRYQFEKAVFNKLLNVTSKCCNQKKKMFYYNEVLQSFKNVIQNVL